VGDGDQLDAAVRRHALTHPGHAIDGRHRGAGAHDRSLGRLGCRRPAAFADCRAPLDALALPAVTWTHVVVLGIVVGVLSMPLGRGSRTATEAQLGRRLRLAIWLALGYAGVLLLGVLVPLARFGWAVVFQPNSTPEDRAALLGLCLGAGVNMVLGFLFFGFVPSGIAFMLARRLQARAGSVQ
jgi:hypothetical protein